MNIKPMERVTMDVKPIKYTLNAALTIRVPQDLLEQARAKSDKTGVTLSHIVRQALEEWVEEK